MCVNGSGLPICNGTSLDRNILFLVCLVSTEGSLISKSEQSVACHISLTRQASYNSIMFASIELDFNKKFKRLRLFALNTNAVASIISWF